LALTARNLFVDCGYQHLVARVNKRSGLTQTQVDAILAKQVSREAQLEGTDDIIYNNATLKELADQVIALHQRYLLTR
jgi:dephospho-CoA kinase